MESIHGFFDLCVNEAAIVGNYEGTIKSLYNYGYRTIAINYDVHEEEQQEFKARGKKKRKSDNQENVVVDKAILPKVSEFQPVQGCESMKILLRLTIHLTTKEFYAKLNKSNEFKKFHIIAILPLNQTIFNITCTEIDADILTIKFYEKNDFRVLRKNYNQLLAHGYHFELIYLAAILNDSSRRVVISHGLDLHTIGRSRNVIISSGITAAGQIRSPYDIINLGLIFGLNQAQSKIAVLQNGRNVYHHGVSRRYGKIAMLSTNIKIASREESNEMDASVIELVDDDEDVADVGHQLKKIKT